MMTSLPKLVSIIGPTASGKTEAGIHLAKEIGGEIVSADSRQLYIDMDIGTAKPEFDAIVKSDEPHDILSADTVNDVKHYLFNIKRPDNRIALAEWQESAIEVIDDLIERDISPVLIGGTMLYVDSVVLNYDIPRVAVNEDLREELEKMRKEDLFKDLQKRDPQAAKVIAPQNKRRIIRAIEVIETTGRPYSEQSKRQPPKYDVRMFGLFPGWNILSKRIKDRVEKMLKQGLAEETRKLQSVYGAELPLLQTINYKQVVSMLAGEITEREAVEKMIQANTRYARRQMSWWKGRKEISWIDSLEKIL